MFTSKKQVVTVQNILADVATGAGMTNFLEDGEIVASIFFFK
jgi:hypothetical protein